MSISLLPQEILDDIIRRVDCRRQSSLALVSTAFRPQVQRMIFHKITLHNARIPDRTERLSDILVRNPTLGEYVQTACLDYDRLESEPERDQAPGMLERVLRACRIQSLTITGRAVSQEIVQLLSPQYLPHLRSLKLNSSVKMSVDALHDVLFLHSPLDQLELHMAHIPWSPRRERIRVKRLHVYTISHLPPGNTCTFDNLYDAEEELTIVVDVTSSVQAAVINEALRAWGSTSRRLCFRIFNFILSQRKLSCCPCSSSC
jgi:hypothetical protein